LIESAKANSIEPYRYLRLVFQALATATSVDDYKALLPWNLKSTA
jgi:transposase